MIASIWCVRRSSSSDCSIILQRIEQMKTSNTAFRWLSAQQITIAGHKVWALRMSYAGELGWEIHLPNSACLDVYNALWVAGEPHEILDYGSFAMNVMRMEKGFKGATELTNEVTLAEADVLRFARTDKDYVVAYVAPEAASAGTELDVIIHGNSRKACVLGEPAYDPQSLRPRADTVATETVVEALL